MSWFNYDLIGKWKDHEGITVNSAPSACSWGMLRTDIFVRRTDNKVWQVWRDVNRPLAWQTPPFSSPPDGTISTGTSTVSWKFDRLGVLAGNVNGNIYLNFWNSRNWSGWMNLNKPRSVVFTSPAAVSVNEYYMEIYTVGNDYNLWRRKYPYQIFDKDPNHNSNWENLGNPGAGVAFLSAPAVGIVNGCVTVFLVGSDGVVYKKWWKGNETTPPNDRNGYLYDISQTTLFKSTPAVINLPNRLWVFCIGKDDNSDIYFREFKPNPLGSWTKFKMTMPSGNKPKGIGGCTFKYDEGTIASLFARANNDHLWELMIPLSFGGII